MAIDNIECPECGGKDVNCAACYGTNRVYITSTEGHYNAYKRYSDVFLALESAAYFVHNCMPESEQKTDFMNFVEKVIGYDVRKMKEE